MVELARGAPAGNLTTTGAAGLRTWEDSLAGARSAGEDDPGGLTPG
ncbi:hypothetical protein Psuf_012460 [Phytohabitans suffuscus]|uniref:Uncharacterized protein n=2 Tax=Phytohabitans suffuscus TaxID=624315 RepID=A0A6F8YD26_9ACTN|nr:hypothetical protein Psuf_012460 [Phytohabitans suffuscus]